MGEDIWPPLGGSAPCRPSSHKPCCLDVALAVEICRVKLFGFMMENGPRNWGKLLLMNVFQLVH